MGVPGFHEAHTAFSLALGRMIQLGVAVNVATLPDGSTRATYQKKETA
jgi:hypothetical protein